MSDRLYDLAYRAACGISHSPESRARFHVGALEGVKNKITENAAKLAASNNIADAIRDQVAADECKRMERLWCAWMGARSRCMSAMIVGPANFPVRQQAKRAASEEKHGRAYFDAQDYSGKRMRRRMGISLAVGHRIGEEGSAEKLRQEADEMQRALDRMKEANKALRQHKGTDERVKALSDLGYSSKEITRILTPIQGYSLGFEGFTLTNLRARIVRANKQAEAAEKLAATKGAWGWEDGEVSAKIDDARVLIFFPGKPDEETRSKLKGAAFKWSPSRGAWSRLDTPNARYAGERLRAALVA